LTWIDYPELREDRESSHNPRMSSQRTFQIRPTGAFASPAFLRAPIALISTLVVLVLVVLSDRPAAA